MRSMMLVALVVPLLILTGCAKRRAKSTAPAADETAAVKPQSQPQAGANKKADEPNWLTDPRFKKDAKAEEPVEAKGASGKQPWVSGVPAAPQAAPGTGVLQPQGQPQPQPGAPAAGPTFQPVSEHDMKDVWIFIENASLASGKMPPPLTTYQALIEGKSPAAELVKNGSIYLTGAPQRDAIWAFETRALANGGWVASPNGVETMTAAQLKARLGK